MLFPIVSVASSYLFVSACLTLRRAFKLLDLYEEHVLARAREQKSHTKAYASLIRAGFLDDLIWPKSLFQKFRALRSWLKS